MRGLLFLVIGLFFLNIFIMIFLFFKWLLKVMLCFVYLKLFGFIELLLYNIVFVIELEFVFMEKNLLKKLY